VSGEAMTCKLEAFDAFGVILHSRDPDIGPILLPGLVYTHKTDIVRQWDKCMAGPLGKKWKQAQGSGFAEIVRVTVTVKP